MNTRNLDCYTICGCASLEEVKGKSIAIFRPTDQNRPGPVLVPTGLAHCLRWRSESHRLLRVSARYTRLLCKYCHT